jgi:hypothetical protein
MKKLIKNMQLRENNRINDAKYPKHRKKNIFDKLSKYYCSRMLFFLVFFVPNIITAQCIIGYNGGTSNSFGNGYLWGQSFTASCSGKLDYVQFYSSNNGNVDADTLKIYSGNSVSGTPVYIQPFSAFSVTANSPIRIILASNFQVNNGNQYTFQFRVGGVDVLFSFSNGYSGGNAFQDGGMGQSEDINFEVNVSATVGFLENKFDSGISIFPNPAIDKIFVDCKELQNVNISIFNLVGDLVMIKDLENKINQIDIGFLTKGIYIMKLINNDCSMQVKLIKK